MIIGKDDETEGIIDDDLTEEIGDIMGDDLGLASDEDTSEGENVIPPRNDGEILESVKIEGEEDSLKKLEKAPDVKKKSSVTKELYQEFNSFLEEKVSIKEEMGEKRFIPTGIDLLDAVMGGGFTIGTLEMIVGAPGSGKSMLAMQALGNAQKVYKNEGLLAGYLDSEHSTTWQRLANLGVRNPKIKPYSEDITVERVFRYLEGLCLFKLEKGLIDTPSVVVWDSIANTLSQKELEAEDPNSVIGYKARLFSLLIPKYVSKCSKFNICLLTINQLRDSMKLGQFAPPKDLKYLSHTKEIPGGNVLKFNSFHLLELKVKSAIDPNKVGFEGFIGKVKLVKNKMFVPNIEIDIVGDFVRGFNNFYTNYNFLVDTKRLKSGAWNYLVNMPDKKFRTKDAKELYDTDENFRKAFNDAKDEAIYKELIEKNEYKIEDEDE